MKFNNSTLIPNFSIIFFQLPYSALFIGHNLIICISLLSLLPTVKVQYPLRLQFCCQISDVFVSLNYMAFGPALYLYCAQFSHMRHLRAGHNKFFSSYPLEIPGIRTCQSDINEISYSVLLIFYSFKPHSKLALWIIAKNVIITCIICYRLYEL